MAREGARVLVADLDAQRCADAAARIRETGGAAVATTVDVGVSGRGDGERTVVRPSSEDASRNRFHEKEAPHEVER